MASGKEHVPLSLAALMAFGGVLGYARAGSKPSLIGGLASAAAYFSSARLIGALHEPAGHSLACATSATLSLSMGARAARTGKLMPAGAISGVSLCVLV